MEYCCSRALRAVTLHSNRGLTALVPGHSLLISLPPRKEHLAFRQNAHSSVCINLVIDWTGRRLLVLWIPVSSTIRRDSRFTAMRDGCISKFNPIYRYRSPLFGKISFLTK